MKTEDRFRTELEVFEANRAAWAAAHPEQYVAIRGTEVIGFFTDFERALEAALQRYAIGECLVKQIFDKDPVYAIF